MIPPEDDLDSAPATDRGYVVEVGLEGSPRRSKGLVNTRECQVCRGGVDLTKPYISAWVRIEDAPVAPRYQDPVFCSRECWSEWATNKK